MTLEETARLQRALTVEFITRHRLSVPAVWFRPSTGSPDARDALADTLDCDLGSWDGPERNLGIRLQDGHLELEFKAGDDAFANAFFLAAEHLRIDVRCAFGVDRVSSVILRIEEQELIETWAPKWPKGFKDRHGQWTETRIKTSSPKTKSANAIYRYSRPLPGSVTPEGVVVWRPKGKPPALDVDIGLEDLEPRALGPTGMCDPIRALAYATLAYWVRTYLEGQTEWDTILTRTLGGWMARCEVEGRAINAKGKSLEGICWAPIDTREQALDLVKFMGRLGATGDLKVAYLHGEAQLVRDPLAPVAGWNALTTLFGSDAKLGIRRAFRAGLDLDIVERMAERYVYDESTFKYYDRDALLKGTPYERTYEGLIRTHSKDPGVAVGKKLVNPFVIFSASQLRTDVLKADMHPGAEPAAILRWSPGRGLLTSDEMQLDEFKVFNTYRGFVIKPAAVVDSNLMKNVLSKLDFLLDLLTQDNSAQKLWLKKFIAWTIQHPEIKQQVAPVIIGGQGIGKSFFGIDLMFALFDELAAQANPGALDDNNFLITPFIGKLVVFIDEIRLPSANSINEIKKLVRNINISGEEKFGHQHDYHIYGRLIMAANQADIGLTAEDAADRALFFIRAHDAESKRKSNVDFLNWTGTLKPFFDEFYTMLKIIEVRQHLMRYFRDLECTRAELEDLTLSSRHDAAIVEALQSRARKVAHLIAASARIHPQWEITAWFNTQHLREAIRREDGSKTRVEAHSVLKEYQQAGVIEQMTGGYYRFKWTYGRLLQKLGEAHNTVIQPNYPVGPGDFEDNDVFSAVNQPPWRGNKQAKKSGDNRYRPFNPNEDLDYLPPED